MKSPLQLWREWRCETRRWAKQGLHPNQLRRGESMMLRYLAECEASQYRPCAKCGCPRYYHPVLGQNSDHFFTDGPVELLDADRRCSR